MQSLAVGTLSAANLVEIARRVNVDIPFSADRIGGGALSAHIGARRNEYIWKQWNAIASFVNTSDDIKKLMRRGDFLYQIDGVTPDEFVKEIKRCLERME